MAYKMKPNKAVAKRFKFTKTGKVKRHHAKTSHLMSGRPSKKRRHLRRPAILAEGLARNMRRLVGLHGKHPKKVEHEKALAAKTQAAAAATESAPA